MLDDHRSLGRAGRLHLEPPAARHPALRYLIGGPSTHHGLFLKATSAVM
jgi:hypothetical protein